MTPEPNRLGQTLFCTRCLCEPGASLTHTKLESSPWLCTRSGESCYLWSQRSQSRKNLCPLPPYRTACTLFMVLIMFYPGSGSSVRVLSLCSLGLTLYGAPSRFLQHVLRESLLNSVFPPREMGRIVNISAWQYILCLFVEEIGCSCFKLKGNDTLEPFRTQELSRDSRLESCPILSKKVLSNCQVIDWSIGWFIELYLFKKLFYFSSW